MEALFTWANIKLLLKYLPQLISLAKTIEGSIEEEIISFKVKRAKDKIEIAFQGNKPAWQVAQEVNDAFKN